MPVTTPGGMLIGISFMKRWKNPVFFNISTKFSTIMLIVVMLFHTIWYEPRKRNSASSYKLKSINIMS